MPRKIRVEYPGAMYHVMSRGEACLRTDWQVHAFCLMKNHYHLVVERPNAGLSRVWLGSKAPTPAISAARRRI